MLTQEFESDIRSRVNPAYVDVRGTESYERAALLGEIDRLRMRVSELEGITAFNSALQELEVRGRVIEEQRRTIEALNTCIGGEGSTTTENIRRFDEIERLCQSEREGWRYADELEQECKRLHSAIQQTLNENGHLADGSNCTLLKLKQAVGIQQCKKCGADMQPGVAMGQTLTGMPDFIGGEVCTVSPGGPGKLIGCRKCSACGWSITA